MVREDGQELYAITDNEHTIGKAVRHFWLRDNVVPYLPVKVNGPNWEWVREHEDFQYVAPKRIIAEKVRRFITTTPKVELWAWYSAYDHVALAQLFGSMQDLPEGVPMCTFDLKQEHVRLGSPALPRQQGGEHNALADARHNQVISRFLQNCILGRA